MQYLRGFSLIMGREQWWMPPLALGGLWIVFGLGGMIPILGLLVTLASIPFLMYLQGWVAATQRRAIRDEPGLPEPFDAEYLVPGLRATAVGFLWGLVMIVPVVGVGGMIAFTGHELDRDVREIVFLLAMGAMGLFVLLWMPLVQIAVVRTNLGRDWSGLEVGAVFQTLAKAPLEAYGGMLLWSLVSIPIALVGMLACLVGVYVAQVFLIAAMGVFWVDVYRVAVERGAPPVTLEDAPIGDVARTFE